MTAMTFKALMKNWMTLSQWWIRVSLILIISTIPISAHRIVPFVIILCSLPSITTFIFCTQISVNKCVAFLVIEFICYKFPRVVRTIYKHKYFCDLFQWNSEVFSYVSLSFLPHFKLNRWCDRFNKSCKFLKPFRWRLFVFPFSRHFTLNFLRWLHSVWPTSKWKNNHL